MGHHVTWRGILPDGKKIRAVQDWPQPAGLRELRGFLGLASYYRRFVKGFAHMAAPLTNLMRKDSGYKWRDHRRRLSRTSRQP